MTNVVLAAALVCAVVVAIVAVRRRATRGGACCSEHEAAPERVRVADRNRAHYPYVTELRVGGMTCDNCAIRVENALNGLPNTWATVSIASKTATVRTKGEPNLATLRDAVSTAGYVVLNMP